VTKFITLAYGDAPATYRQSLMLLVSLIAYAPEPTEIVVVTDHPERFVWFGTRIEIDYLDGRRLEQWRGPTPFSMRHKLELALAMTGATGVRVWLVRIIPIGHP